MQTATESTSREISESRVLRGGFVLAIGLVAAQLTGFVRQVAIGYLLGTGPEADALSAAMAPVELWWSVLAVAVIFGFVPKLSGGSAGESTFGDILKPISRLAFGSTVGFLLFANPIVRVFAPGLSANTTSIGAGLLRVLGLSPAAVGCSFVYSALLFSHRRFAVPAIHHATVNLATIAGALLLHRRFGAYSFAIGYSVGAWAQLAGAHLYTRRLIRPGRGKPISLLDLLRGPAPILGQALAMELNTAVSRAYASTFGPGVTAAFEYGFKIFRVPLALLVVPLSQSLLPEISSLHRSRSDQSHALGAVTRAAWFTTLVGAAAMIGMMIWSEPLVRLLFQRGAFGRASTGAVATILLGYMPVLVGRGLCDFLSRALFGMGRFRVPLLAASLALAANFVICAVLPSREPLLIGLGAIVGFIAAAALIVSYVRHLWRND